MKNNRTIGILRLLFPSIIWGLAFVAQDQVADSIEPFTLNCIRCLIGAFVLLPVLLIKNKIQNRPVLEKDKSKRKKLIIASVLCGVSLCIGMNFQQFGIALYPNDAAVSGRSGFITAQYVLLVPILSLLLKKKLGINTIISVVLATIGLYLLCFSKGLDHVYLGDIIVLISALGFALQILFVDKYVGEIEGVKLSLLQFIICGVLSGILMFIFEKPSINKIMEVILPILYLGGISSGIGYTLQIIGQKFSNNPTLDSIIMSLESVFAVLGGAIILNEHLSNNELIGCIIMFLAIIISQLPKLTFEKKNS